MVKLGEENAVIEIIDAARYLIYLASETGVPMITPLKLQKILYLAQGWHFRWYDRPLFNEQFEAWAYGPVNNGVYQRYKEYGRSKIPASEGFVSEDMIQIEKHTLDVVWSMYGDYTASQLIQLTHEQEPWQKAYSSDGIISNDSIRDYFLSAY